jgi:(E)-4-hydroxy-3-methylbut-2-enyl-diphosphate synthase
MRPARCTELFDLLLSPRQGGAPRKINLCAGKNPVKFNIPEAGAVDRLVDLIREHGKWREPGP